MKLTAKCSHYPYFSDEVRAEAEQTLACLKTKYATTSVPILAAHTKMKTMRYAERPLRRQEQPISIMHSQLKTRGAPSKFCIWLQKNGPNFISGPYRIGVGAR